MPSKEWTVEVRIKDQRHQRQWLSIHNAQMVLTGNPVIVTLWTAEGALQIARMLARREGTFATWGLGDVLIRVVHLSELFSGDRGIHISKPERTINETKRY